jgi:GH15 family glucan-1,4-alpha-glucosidase
VVELRGQLPAAVLGNGSLLATISATGRVEHVWCPHPDRELDLAPFDLNIELEGPCTQEYIGSAQMLRTTGDGVVIEDVVHPSEPILLRRITFADRSVRTVSVPSHVNEPFEAILEQRARLDAARLNDAEAPLQQAAATLYERSLLVFDALSDSETGAVIAAPELDPERIYSGGYGFVWARDLAFLILAFLAAGRHELARGALFWLPRAQDPDGLWAQRHHTDGSVAPSWCEHQIDETGSVLFAYEAAWRELGDAELDGLLWPSARRAADFLVSSLDDEGVPCATADLWEEREGRHAYTTASVAAGLCAAASFAARHEPALRRRYADAAERVRAAIDRVFWSDKECRYLRTVGDPIVDASLLGLAWPFAVVDPASARMRATVAAIEEKLGRPNGGICRYERDTYAGGNPWVLAALWLGLWSRQVGDERRYERAIAYAKDVATPLGLLAEQVTEHGEPAWVLPLGWSHAMFVLTARPELSFIRSTERVTSSPVRVAAN